MSAAGLLAERGTTNLDRALDNVADISSSNESRYGLGASRMALDLTISSGTSRQNKAEPTGCSRHRSQKN